MTLGWREWDSGDIGIYNVETRSLLGHVERHGKSYQVQDGERLPIAVVASINDAGCALADHYQKHREWRQDEDQNEYYVWTEFGLLQVQQEEGSWFVSRNAGQSLMRDGEVATFPTPQEAQSAADAHRSDGPAGSRGSSDGLSWFMYEMLPGVMYEKLPVDGILN